MLPAQLKLHHDIAAMFANIGINEAIEIRDGPSDMRQQTAYVDVLGFEWRFVQEGNDQQVYLHGKINPTLIMPAREIELLLGPPSEDKASAKPRYLRERYRRLEAIASYLRGNLQKIVGLITCADLEMATRRL